MNLIWFRTKRSSKAEPAPQAERSSSVALATAESRSLSEAHEPNMVQGEALLDGRRPDYPLYGSGLLANNV